jgi:hypothetical protein
VQPTSLLSPAAGFSAFFVEVFSRTRQQCFDFLSEVFEISPIPEVVLKFSGQSVNLKRNGYGKGLKADQDF